MVPITGNQSFLSYMYHMLPIQAFKETEAWLHMKPGK